MDNKQMNRAIRSKVGTRGRHDHLPHCARRGGRLALAQLLGEFGLNKGVEVGTQKGKFAEYMCQHNPDIDLTCVDPWMDKNYTKQPRYDRIFNEAVKRLSPFNVKMIREKSMDALRHFEDGSLDFAYIDGNHHFNYVCPDIIFWSEKVRSGGMVGVHDYTNFTNDGVIPAVDGYTLCNLINPWYATRELNPTAFWVKP
jgi:predicted O-methyltransferase YrrM